MYVQDVRRAIPWRISGSAYEVAAHHFPEPHSKTTSYRARGALTALKSSRDLSKSSEKSVQALDRASLTMAMAKLRKRLLVHGPSAAPRVHSSNSSLAACCLPSHCPGLALPPALDALPPQTPSQVGAVFDQTQAGA